MDKNQIERLLPFWKDLTAQDRAYVLENCASAFYPKGTLMRRCEQDCSGVMLILSGQLRTYIVSDEGREVTLFRVHQDEICVLSATGLMDNITFDVLIDAVEDTQAIMIPSRILSPLMERCPRIEAYIYRTATERFSDVLWTMQQILFLSADRRVALFLRDECARTQQATLSMTHDEIARYIGSAREVVTKVLKYLAQEGVVALGQGKFTVLDPALLNKHL